MATLATRLGCCNTDTITVTQYHVAYVWRRHEVMLSRARWGTPFIHNLSWVPRLAIQDDGNMWLNTNRSRTGWRRIVVAPKRGREELIPLYCWSKRQ